MRLRKILGNNGNQLAILSNLSGKPASNTGMDGHAPLRENLLISQKPPSCFWAMMNKS